MDKDMEVEEERRGKVTVLGWETEEYEDKDMEVDKVRRTSIC